MDALSLPSRPPASRPSLTGSEKDVAQAGRRLLIVEDEVMVAMMLEDMLADLGCEVVAVAASVAQGLDFVRTGEFDGAVLDVNIAGEPVFPVADALAGRGLPFLYATGYGRAGLRENDAERPVMQKPYSLTDLADRLKDLGLLNDS